MAPLWHEGGERWNLLPDEFRKAPEVIRQIYKRKTPSRLSLALPLMNSVSDSWDVGGQEDAGALPHASVGIPSVCCQGGGAGLGEPLVETGPSLLWVASPCSAGDIWAHCTSTKQSSGLLHASPAGARVMVALKSQCWMGARVGVRGMGLGTGLGSRLEASLEAGGKDRSAFPQGSTGASVRHWLSFRARRKAGRVALLSCLHEGVSDCCVHEKDL